MWDFILSMLVIIHLVTEYVHYTFEFISGKREKGLLLDIQRHRVRSKKTEMLIKIQEDLDLIKKELFQRLK